MNTINQIYLQRSVCPRCGKPLEGFKVSYEYIRCPHCGYEEHSAALTAIGAFALGAIAALGAAALIYLLSQDSKGKERGEYP